MSSLKLDFIARDDHLEEDAAEIIKKARPQWDSSKLAFKLFTDGITNKLIGGYQQGNKKDMVLVRVYGDKTELFIDRNVERDTIQLLHKEGLGPELYAYFTNGLAYEFLPGVTLDTKSCRDPKVFPLICDSAAKLHAVDAPGSKSIVLWDKIDRFLKLMPTSFAEPERQTRLEKEVGSKEEIEAIAAELRGGLSNLTCPLVFSHNDLLLGNVIYNEEKQTASFIDFEYAGYNYQPYDVANHFNEYAGITDVNFDLYPEKEHQLVWIKEYLTRYKQHSKTASQDISSKELDNFYIMVNKFSVASHFFWGVWALVQAKESSIDFDFLDYAILRLNEYKKMKKWLAEPLLE